MIAYSGYVYGAKVIERNQHDRNGNNTTQRNNVKDRNETMTMHIIGKLIQVHGMAEVPDWVLVLGRRAIFSK